MGLTHFSVGDDLGEGQWVRFMLGRSGVGVNIVEGMELILTIWDLDESGDGVGSSIGGGVSSLDASGVCVGVSCGVKRTCGGGLGHDEST